MDITRFTKPSKLFDFAGQNPSVYQSDNFQTKHTRISNRGSKALRYALTNTTHNVVKNNQMFKNITSKKKTDNHSHYNTHNPFQIVRMYQNIFEAYC